METIRRRSGSIPATENRSGPGAVRGSSGSPQRTSQATLRSREDAGGEPAISAVRLARAGEDLAPALGRLVRFEWLRDVCSVHARHAEQAELVLESLQPVHAMLDERDPRRRRSPSPTRERAPRPGQRPTSRGPRCSRRVRRASTRGLEFAEAHAGPDLDAELTDRLARRHGTPDRIGGPFEGDEEPVAGGVDSRPPNWWICRRTIR